MPFGPKSVDYEQMNIISTLSDFYLDFLSCALGLIRGRDSLSSLAINKDDLNNQAGSKIFLIICLEYTSCMFRRFVFGFLFDTTTKSKYQHIRIQTRLSY